MTVYKCRMQVLCKLRVMKKDLMFVLGSMVSWAAVYPYQLSMYRIPGPMPTEGTLWSSMYFELRLILLRGIQPFLLAGKAQLYVSFGEASKRVHCRALRWSWKDLSPSAFQDHLDTPSIANCLSSLCPVQFLVVAWCMPVQIIFC